MTLHQTLMGAETEYACTGVRNGRPAETNQVATELILAARRRCRHVLGQGGSSLFLANGARLYVDQGAHPEYATPECRDPWQLVRHLRAGDRLMTRVADDLVRAARADRVTIFRTNVDYGSGNSWGSHESYLATTEPAALADDLIPHLISRIVMIGAGGFVPNRRELKFTLAPRAWSLQRRSSPGSMRNRGIFHTKNETLARGSFSRIHVLAGETLCSDRAALLRHGTTALVIATIEAAKGAPDGLMPRRPVEALRRLASDPTCTVRVEVEGGRRLTAIDIQRALLDWVEAHLAVLPAWGPAISGMWRETLDLLAVDPTRAAGLLDWPLKCALFRRYAGDSDDWRSDVTRGGGLRFSSPRHPLFEADMRFGQLGPDGVHNRLLAGGHLRSGVIPDGDIEEACRRPPSDTRAFARGRAIQMLSGSTGATASWSFVRDRDRQRRLDLGDPFANNPSWSRQKERVQSPPLGPAQPREQTDVPTFTPADRPSPQLNLWR